MAVEAAVGEAGRLHHLGHAHRLEPLLAEQAARLREDAPTVLPHLILGDPHPEKSPVRSVDTNMIAIIFEFNHDGDHD